MSSIFISSSRAGKAGCGRVELLSGHLFHFRIRFSLEEFLCLVDVVEQPFVTSGGGGELFQLAVLFVELHIAFHVGYYRGIRDEG